MNGRAAYAAAVAALIAAVAVSRADLFLDAARVSAAVFAQGGAARLRLLFEAGLFAAILAGTWRTLSAKPTPRHDAAVLAAGLAAGWLAEAWGTRCGLWAYYTGERPPLWIVPAWPLGAAVVERAAAGLRGRFGPAPAGAFWALAALALALVVSFCAGFFAAGPSVWGGAALVAVLLAAGARPAEDFWTLAAGMACVFFADLWGTTNGCWAYYLTSLKLGLWRGIAFGMAFDAAVTLAVLRAVQRAGF